MIDTCSDKVSSVVIEEKKELKKDKKKKKQSISEQIDSSQSNINPEIRISHETLKLNSDEKEINHNATNKIHFSHIIIKYQYPKEDISKQGHLVHDEPEKKKKKKKKKWESQKI